MSPVIGVVFRPEVEPEALPGFARAADAAGIDELWLWEDCFRHGGLGVAGVALASTERIRVATGVLPMPLRNVALTAMEAAALERMFPGRFQLGVGHGVQDWMAQVGARPASPLTLMREYVPALRALLDGDEVTTDGRYVTLDRVRLDRPAPGSARVWAAGEGPKTLALTGELADGTVLTSGSSPTAVADAVGRIAEGRAAAGRPGPHPVAVFVMTVFADSTSDRPEAGRRLADEWDEWGLEGDKRCGVHGTPADVAEQLRPYLEAGATTIALQPTIDADRAAFVRGAAHVAELLRVGH